MRRNRLSVALIAATSASLALVTPVASAQSSDGAAGGSSAGQGSSQSATTAPGDGTGEEATPPAENESGLSPECQAEVDQAIADHKVYAENGGSSFIGPQELVRGIFAGYGSSGLPETPECALPPTPEEQEEAIFEQLPDWAQSFRPSDDVREAFGWISMFITLFGGVVQLLTIVASVNPAILDPIRAALTQAGIKF